MPYIDNSGFIKSLNKSKFSCIYSFLNLKWKKKNDNKGSLWHLRKLNLKGGEEEGRGRFPIHLQIVGNYYNIARQNDDNGKGVRKEKEKA